MSRRTKRPTKKAAKQQSVFDLMGLASQLADEIAHDAPFTDRGHASSDNSIARIADCLDPELGTRDDEFQRSLDAVSADLAATYDRLKGELLANREDAAYLLGLAVGQRIRIAALGSRGPKAANKSGTA